MLEPGWMHFDQTPTRDGTAPGRRRLSVAVVHDGVTFVVARDGRPTSCTISFDDWDLLQHYVDIVRP
jgi:hypothetical protein